MTASDPRVGEIQARLTAVPEVWDCDGFSDGNITHLSLYEGTNQGRMIASDITSHEDADFLRYARSDVAYLLAELRDRDEKLANVEALAEAVTIFENALGLDLSDDDFDRGWHGRGREMADQIRAAVAAANGGER